MRPIKFLYCTLKKKHDYAMVTGINLHKKRLKRLPKEFHYEFCLRCHHVNVVKEENEKNLLERAKKKIK